jgi:hypothetical protein
MARAEGGAGGAGRRAGRLRGRAAALAAIALAALPAPALADAAALRKHRPLLRYDSRERIYATGLETMTGRFVEHGSLRTSNRLVNGEDRVLAAANPVLGPPPLTPRFLRPRRGARDERSRWCPYRIWS